MEPVDIRLRSWIPPAELDAKKGRIVTDRDFNVLCTGPVRLWAPTGPLIAIYLPGVLGPYMDAAWPVLRSIRQPTDNRGLASGTPRVKRGDQKRTRTRNIFSATIGAVDPGPASSKVAGRLPACRLTAWTGKHPDQWAELRPLFMEIARCYRRWGEDRYRRQAAAAQLTHPDWVIPGTPFTTVTVNNSYSTGVHQDTGDLPAGFSTLAVARRGQYTGGHLVLPEYRVAFDMRDGDLLIFDAHQWHGNTAMLCEHQALPLARPCPAGCERVSLVTYFRTKMLECGSSEQEAARAMGQFL